MVRRLARVVEGYARLGLLLLAVFVPPRLLLPVLVLLPLLWLGLWKLFELLANAV